MILVDSNIPMYLVGAEHPLKQRARLLLDRCLLRRERLVADAEVFQEILHRYAALRRLDAVQPAFDVLKAVVDDVFAIMHVDVERAKDIVLARSHLSARDSLHIAVMERMRVTSILSFHADFDGYPGITRISR